MKLNRKRLMNVSKACRENPNPNEFTMEKWGHKCGTPACSLGNYAFRRDLQKTFKLSNNGNLIGPDDQSLSPDSHPIRDHFGLTSEEANLLFGGTGCGNAKTPNDAAKYIEWFCTKPDN